MVMVVGRVDSDVDEGCKDAKQHSDLVAQHGDSVVVVVVPRLASPIQPCIVPRPLTALTHLDDAPGSEAFVLLHILSAPLWRIIDPHKAGIRRKRCSGPAPGK